MKRKFREIAQVYSLILILVYIHVHTETQSGDRSIHIYKRRNCKIILRKLTYTMQKSTITQLYFVKQETFPNPGKLFQMRKGVCVKPMLD